MEDKVKHPDTGLGSLFVTCDPYGIPQKYELRHAFPNSISTLEGAFVDYMREERQNAARHAVLPDLHIHRYDLPSGLSATEPDETFGNDPRKLQEFIGIHRLQPVCDFSLRRFDALMFILKERRQEQPAPAVLKMYVEDHTRLGDGLKVDFEKYMALFEEYDLYCRERLSVVETTRGALLFPYAEMKGNPAAGVLQYIADHYFSPQASQWQYVSTYDIESPTRQQIQAARRSGYMLSLNERGFLPHRADWQSLADLAGPKYGESRYELRPTYHDFHYFIEDNGLQVSPRNNELFTLIFIAEYGCPQNFQRDPVYADHPDRRAFVRLDRQLEEAKEKTPGGDERFYRIQHRQQLLARDILRDKYGVVIPEPQLTGPSRLQESKQTQKQGIKPRKTNLKL